MKSPTDKKSRPPSAAANTTRLRMRVDGMTCPSCERHVEQALLGAGASEADADFRRNEAVLNVPGTPDEAALRAAVEAAGHRPGGVEPRGPTPEHEPGQHRDR